MSIEDITNPLSQIENGVKLARSTLKETVGLADDISKLNSDAQLQKQINKERAGDAKANKKVNDKVMASQRIARRSTEATVNQHNAIKATMQATLLQAEAKAARHDMLWRQMGEGERNAFLANEKQAAADELRERRQESINKTERAELWQAIGVTFLGLVVLGMLFFGGWLVMSQ